MRSTYGRGSPQSVDTAATDSSAHASTRSSCAHSRTRLTPNGRSVSARVARMLSRTDPAGVQVSASMPRPPAFETAATSSGVVALPTGACTTGAVRSSMRQSGVISRLALRGIADHSYHTPTCDHTAVRLLGNPRGGVPFSTLVDDAQPVAEQEPAVGAPLGLGRRPPSAGRAEAGGRWLGLGPQRSRVAIPASG